MRPMTIRERLVTAAIIAVMLVIGVAVGWGIGELVFGAWR